MLGIGQFQINIEILLHVNTFKKRNIAQLKKKLVLNPQAKFTIAWKLK